MPKSSNFARRLREARLRTGLSQKALGIKAGIDEFCASPRMNQYERGRHLPDLLTVEHLAAATGVPMPYFFAQEDELAEVLILWGQMNEHARAELLLTARTLVTP
jgi:transcriptional regulator with XRE-family HTH domain